MRFSAFYQGTRSHHRPLSRADIRTPRFHPSNPPSPILSCSYLFYSYLNHFNQYILYGKIFRCWIGPLELNKIQLKYPEYCEFLFPGKWIINWTYQTRLSRWYKKKVVLVLNWILIFYCFLLLNPLRHPVSCSKLKKTILLMEIWKVLCFGNLVSTYSGAE